MKRFLLLSGLLVTVLTFMACDNSTDPADNGDNNQTSDCATLSDGEMVKVTSPEGGETFNYGDTVNIAFTVVKKIPRVNIKVSINDGRTYSDILKKQGEDVTVSGDVACGKYLWVIGDEGVIVNYEPENTNCIIKVEEYGDPQEFGLSETFTVIKN